MEEPISKELLEQITVALPFVRKMKKKLLPPGEVYIYSPQELSTRDLATPASQLGLPKVNEVTIEQLVPVSFTFPHSLVPSEDLSNIDFVSTLRDYFNEDLATGRDGYVGIVDSVATDVTQFGTTVPAIRFQGSNRLGKKANIEIRRARLEETGDSVSLKLDTILSCEAFKTSAGSFVLSARPAPPYQVEPGDSIYKVTRSKLLGLPDIFALYNANKGATINLSSNPEALSSTLLRYYSVGKTIMLHPIVASRFLSNLSESSLADAIEYNDFLPEDEVYLLDPADFTFAFYEPNVALDPARFLQSVHFAVAIVCENPSMQLRILL